MDNSSYLTVSPSLWFKTENVDTPDLRRGMTNWALLPLTPVNSLWEMTDLSLPGGRGNSRQPTAAEKIGHLPHLALSNGDRSIY